MDEYISKPVTAQSLNETLEKLLAADAAKSSAVTPEPEPADAAPVEIERIQDITMGDPAFEEELIKTFLTDTERRLQELEFALHEQNSHEVERLSHSIKGSSANAGARGLQEIAHRLEQMGADVEEGAALELLEDLKSEFDRVRDYLQSHVDAMHVPLAASTGALS
jgi:HPt (histidine-containing phosphotransfer) domain-containing protein